ncbi:MAG TPA: hypothetical protein VKZ53_10985 [Candidatus Angelobacter sp.]|nr:hypothetical protein [Candidatus Angelobacter sp.]
MSIFSQTKALFFTICFAVSLASAADTITGKAINQTTGQPASGDDVILLRLAQGMQEEARATVDAQGAFALNVTFPKDDHVVRVFHRGVNYDRTVIPGSPVEVKVYDAEPKIEGIYGMIGIVELGAAGKVLNVTEDYDINNPSNPPKTQANPRNFDLQVPDKAEIELVQVKGPESIWVTVRPTPAKNRSNLYSINFPLRPGHTLFKIKYHLPYEEGHSTLQPRPPYPIERLGIMLPQSMQFTGKGKGDNGGFISTSEKGIQVQVVAGGAKIVGKVPAFEVSGGGEMPEITAHANAGPQHITAPPAAAAPGAPGAPANGGRRSAPSSAGGTQQSKEFWLMITGIGTLVVVGLAVFLKMRPKTGPAAPRKVGLEALKEELFRLENERLSGSISAEKYAATKEALNRSIQRAMESTASGVVKS